MYRKEINPLYYQVGKRKKITGYLGEIFDGDTCIHDKEYKTFHAAEIALDKLVLDLMTRNPQTEAELASTCCFCSGLHSPQSCPDMRALLFADPPIDPLPDDGPGDPIPGDPGYEYRIGSLIYPLDELAYIEQEAREQCEADFKRCVTCGGDGDCPDCDPDPTAHCVECGGPVTFPGFVCDECMAWSEIFPLDVDFAPIGFEV